MSIFDWFAKQEKSGPPIQQEQHKEREIADGLWTKCEACGALTYAKDLKTQAGPVPLPLSEAEREEEPVQIEQSPAVAYRCKGGGRPNQRAAEMG